MHWQRQHINECWSDNNILKKDFPDWLVFLRPLRIPIALQRDVPWSSYSTKKQESISLIIELLKSVASPMTSISGLQIIMLPTSSSYSWGWVKSKPVSILAMGFQWLISKARPILKNFLRFEFLEKFKSRGCCAYSTVGKLEIFLQNLEFFFAYLY